MSIETSADTIEMSSVVERSKSDKKHKSSHDKKKRKRDPEEDGQKSRSKSKKQKADKQPIEQTHIEETETTSPFHIQTYSLYLPLAPISQKYPLEGLCAEHLSPLILTYYPPFNGVLLSYSNPRLSEKPFRDDGQNLLLNSIDEYAVSWSWVTADFLLFKPEKGVVLEGYINLQNEGHLGIVCWNLFNASIERKRLPEDWQWKDVSELENEGDAQNGETYAEDGAGYYVDRDGNKIQGLVKFRVRQIESSHDRERGFLSIEGTMLSEANEAALVESERKNLGTSRDREKLSGSRALGATSLGIVTEDTEEASGRRQHRRY